MGAKNLNFISTFSLLLIRRLVNFSDPKLGYVTSLKIGKKLQQRNHSEDEIKRKLASNICIYRDIIGDF